MNNNNKSDLRQKLRQKLALKKANRTKKVTLKKISAKSTDIYETTELLMRDVAILSTKIKNPIQRAKMLKTQYKWLHDNYFPIFKATIYGEMNLGLLRMMLNQKDRIDNKELSAKDASLQVGDVLAKKYGVDVEKLEKHALKVMKEKNIPIPKEYQNKQ